MKDEALQKLKDQAGAANNVQELKVPLIGMLDMLIEARAEQQSERSAKVPAKPTHAEKKDQ